VLVLLVAVDFLEIAYQQLPLAFRVQRSERAFPGPPVREIVNVRQGLGYPCVERGYGVIEGYEPMLGYRRDAPSLRLAREDPGYRGEIWTAAGIVQPVFWSPNRIVLQVEPGTDVWINQNPGSWWWSGGRQLFPGRRCAERMLPFIVTAGETGRIELEIRPRGLALGMMLDALGALLLATAAFGVWRQPGITSRGEFTSLA
jgi:hypothetical protein